MRLTMRQLAGLVWALIALTLITIADARAAEPADVREAELRARAAEAVVRGLERRMRFQRVAQAREADEAMARELEREERELERERMREAEARASEAELEARLDEAQERLEEAARQVAELSSQLAGDAMVMALEGLRSIAPRPMLGINIASTTDAADGVGVVGVTPGGPADEAGLQAGDVLIRVDDVDLTGAGGERAEARLTEFMQAVEDGQAVTVTFLRGGEEQQAVVTPRRMNPLQLAFSMDENYDFDLGDLDIPEDLAPHALRLRLGHAGPWGDMELVSLSPDLARYFGTEEGLLVVRAPGDAALQLRDGDVILDIDGRKPTSPGHAMRILRSYAAGERLGLRIVRDREPLSLELEMPAETMGLEEPEPPALHPSRSLHPSQRGDRVIRIEPQST